MERATFGIDVDGPRLRKLRKDRGRSVSAVAAEAGISVQYLSFIERGQRRPLPPVFARICGALGIEANDRDELLVGADRQVA
jgi:transcriptional regulator with XRE-family HTH domain